MISFLDHEINLNRNDVGLCGLGWPVWDSWAKGPVSILYD